MSGAAVTPVTAVPLTISVRDATTCVDEPGDGTTGAPKLTSLCLVSRMRANSAGLTDGWSSGRSRNQYQKATHQTTPIPPKIQKMCRQWVTVSPLTVVV